MRSARASRALLCAVALATTWATACSDQANDEAEARRKVLTPVAIEDSALAAYQRNRLFDDKGNLLPSEDKLAGIFVPRGFKQTFAFEREWYLDGIVQREKVEAYFKERLTLSSAPSYPATHTLELFAATPKDTPDAPKVLVRVYPKPGPGEATRVYIRQASPEPARWPSQEEVRAQIAAKRRD